MAGELAEGSVFGRWTVVKRVAPAKRSSETYARARVLVRCACGHQQHVFLADLQGGKTRGCKSFRCLIRWEGAREVQRAIGELLAAGAGASSAGGRDGG